MTTNWRLPVELIVEILSWLPAQNLWPFRCVCKPWLHLLTTDPHFAKLNFDRNTNPGIIAKSSLESGEFANLHLAFDYESCDKAIKLELPFHQKTNEYYLSGVCNGLLCIFDYNNDEVYIFNPITKDHVTIPYSTTPSPLPGFLEDTEFAFGFHQVINQYKVIKIFGRHKFPEANFHSQVSVYTLGGSSWRTVSEDIPYNLSLSERPCPIVNGLVHWLGMRSGSFSRCAILAFDLKDEVFQEVEPPNDVNFDEESCVVSIGELGGELCIFCDHDIELVVWAMKEYGSVWSWAKQITILYDWLCTQMHPLGVVAHSGDIILMKNGTELILYHPDTNSISSLKSSDFVRFDLCTYIASIISPRVISGARNMNA